MTRAEWKAWAMSLKPGDKVIVKGWHSLEIATVRRITPTGRVNTDKGVFAQREWLDYYTGYGETSGELVPATNSMYAVNYRDGVWTLDCYPDHKMDILQWAEYAAFRREEDDE